MKKWLLVLLVFVLAFPAGALAGGYITSAEIVDGAVKTADLGKGAVTLKKLASNSVGTGKIIDGSIQAADLAVAYAPASHSHTEYYTKAEVNSLIAGLYTKAEVNALIANLQGQINLCADPSSAWYCSHF